MFPKYEYRNCPIHVSRRAHQGSYPGRFHKHLEIMLIRSSQVKVIIEGQSYLLQPGDLYIAFPNVLHAIEATDADALVMLADFEKLPLFQDALLHNRPETPVLRAGEFDAAVCDVMERMTRLMAGEGPYKQEALTGYANALLGELLGCLKLEKRNTDSSLTQQLTLYILQNYTKPITLEQIAQALGYNKFHISREISSLFGCNLRMLINSYRIGMAQNLLISTDLPVSQIAKECGFKNQSAFNRIFLSQTGITPGCYRRQVEQAPEMPAVYWKD